MTRILMTTLIVAACAAPSAWAQTGNPATMSPGTPQSAAGMPAPNTTNVSDRLFAEQATIGGKAEVILGNLADKQTKDKSVREFAQQMVKDHSLANERLTKLAAAANIPLPGGLDAEHHEIQDKLEKLQGSTFDEGYVSGQVADHQKAVQLLEYEIGSGQDAQLKQFAEDTLPIVLHHLQMAQNVQMMLNESELPKSSAEMNAGSATMNPGSPTQSPSHTGTAAKPEENTQSQ